MIKQRTVNSVSYNDYDFYRFLKNAAESCNPIPKILEEHNLTFDKALSNSEDYRQEFQLLMKKHNLTSQKPEIVMLDILNLLDKNADEDLIKLCSMVLIDDGLLFQNNYDDEQTVIEGIKANEKLNSLMSYLKNYPEYKLRLENLIKFIKIGSVGEINLEEQANLWQMSLQHDFIYKNSKNNTYLMNIGELVRLVNSNEMLRTIKPYVYSAVLCRKHKMMLERNDYTPNIKGVFKFKEYKIHADNGKNFATYQSYIELYEQLRRYYADDEETDTEFSDYCFASLSNLCDWYHMNFEPDENIPKSFRSKIVSYFGRIDFIGDTYISDDYYLEDFIEENPVITIAFENTYNDNFELFKSFVNARYNIENTDKIVDEFFKLSGAEKMNHDTQNSRRYAEVFLLDKMDFNIRNMLLESLEEIYR